MSKPLHWWYAAWSEAVGLLLLIAPTGSFFLCSSEDGEAAVICGLSRTLAPTSGGALPAQGAMALLGFCRTQVWRSFRSVFLQMSVWPGLEATWHGLVKQVCKYNCLLRIMRSWPTSDPNAEAAVFKKVTEEYPYWHFGYSVQQVMLQGLFSSKTIL